MEDRWEKVLYRKNANIPDNFTHNKFLEDLKHNVHFKPVRLTTALIAATRVSTHLSIVVLFFITFFQLKSGKVNAETVFFSSSFAVLLSYVVFLYFNSRFRWKDHVKSVMYFLLIGYPSTPILKTLTNTISTDTIYAMTSLLMAVHLLFHHYGMDARCVSPYLSLNAALCGAICLASRLETTLHAFVLLTIAVESFALFPRFYDAAGHALLLSLLVKGFSVFVVLYLMPITATVLFCLALIFVNIVCPVCFVWAQRYKKNIHGPWDEAMIH